MATSLLDLAGVLLIGLVGALSVTTIQSQPPPAVVSSVAEYLGLGDISSQDLVLVLAGAAGLVLLTKSLVSSLLTRRVLVFLANRQALVSARLSRALLQQPLTFVQMRSSQETSYALISGAGAATSQILGQLVIAATEFAVLMLLGIALLLISPWAALGAITFFALIGFALQKAMGDWATRIGAVSADADIASLDVIQEALGSYREITVSDRRPFYVDRIQELRWRAAKVAADIQFIGMLPKYVFEAALVAGGLSLAGVLFATQDAVAAVGTLALFLAAGTRVMPSLLRLQGSALSLRAAAGAAGPTFDLARDLGHPQDSPTAKQPRRPATDFERLALRDFEPSIVLRSVTFTYPGQRAPALNGISLSVPAGASLALVGRSGAGKSTLADVILGLLIPNTGQASVGGMDPQECLVTWPGALAYVPQDVSIVKGTIRSNVALGLPTDVVDDGMVWEALRRAHLDDYLREQREGLDTVIGERGVRLSGGQRQRLGIARALYTRPRLLVLDEATSSLDAQAEQAIAETLRDLEGEVTTIVIAHRLSTVRDVDELVYLDSGQVAGRGTFKDLVDTVPDFQHQAHLMGLVDGNP